MSGEPSTPTIALVVIGDEVLSGRVEDLNSTYLSRRLTELGCAVERVVVIPDDVQQIATDVADCAARFSHVITTGGVGPTHDDVSMAGVAAAFSRSLERHAEAEAAIRNFYHNEMNEAALRMADLPAGAELILKPGMRFPVVRVKNVWVFPGSPHLLQRKFESVCEYFTGTPYITRELRLNSGEPEIARFLTDIQRRFTDVTLGSYPQEPGADFRLLLTLKGKQQTAVDAAYAALQEGLTEAR